MIHQVRDDAVLCAKQEKNNTIIQKMILGIGIYPFDWLAFAGMSRYSTPRGRRISGPFRADRGINRRQKPNRGHRRHSTMRCHVGPCTLALRDSTQQSTAQARARARAQAQCRTRCECVRLFLLALFVSGRMDGWMGGWITTVFS